MQRKMNVVVLGATGDVGRGIVTELLQAGHAVAAVARNAGRLDALRAELGSAPALLNVTGSLASDADADTLLQALRVHLPTIDAVVVSVNARRQPAPLLTHSSVAFATLINQDLVTHYTAARCFGPALAPGGVLLGIGGGSCDFVLHDGVPQSVAQGGLRMLYRGLAHEFREQDIAVRELIIASVVNGASTRAFAHPAWVTELEVGQQVARILADPAAHVGPVLRIARRDASGRPVYSDEGPSRVQGFRT
jgi:NAD(P)-dependent dehydrogenase (short-subunit alcohol dehydrogenase family)